jgi:hypothetical protein
VKLIEYSPAVQRVAPVRNGQGNLLEESGMTVDEFVKRYQEKQAARRYAPLVIMISII